MTIAVLLIGVGLVPVLSLFPTGTRQAVLTEGHVHAEAAGLAALDRWVQGAVAYGPALAAERETGRRQVPGPSGMSPLEVTLESSAVEDCPGLWKVSAMVEWTGPPADGSKPHALTLEKLFCKPDLSLSAQWPLDTGTGLASPLAH
ncbi:MAG: hypothetical protein HYY25_00965 [Candidatus Wallbacteria bacterium]|nr:hypothetical protein [Candidatus Wallbacteria bacterium]MBI4869916.1 hypothetical protein [Candidatus Wallbacteria bacterium]